jgi:hypothetical protein
VPLYLQDGPSNAIDGNGATRWTTGTGQVPNQSITVDFGGTVSLTQVVLDNTGGNAGDYPRGFDIGISSNGTSFTSVATGTPGVGATITINFPAAMGRYLKITQTATFAGSWWSVDEIRVVCTVPGVNPDAGLIDPYDPINWTATASKSAGNDPPNQAIDTSGSTRWSTGSDQVGGEVFNLDIGSVATASQIWLVDNGDFPAMYKLEVSTNGTTYTQVATGAGAATTKIVFPTQQVRYFRITQTGAVAVWWSIYSISVRP